MAKNTFATIGILAVLLLSFGVVSAYSHSSDNISVITTSELPSPVIPGTSHDITINITNNYGENITLSWADTSATSGITANVPINDTIINGITKEYIVTYSIPSDFEGTNIQHKVDLVTYNATGEITTFHPYSPATYTAEDPEENDTDPTPSSTFCEKEIGQLEITEFDVINNGKGDDTEWEYLDEIKIEVTIENTGNENINDVLVEMKIVDEDGNTISKRKIDLNDDEIDLGRIRDDEEETVTFKIDEVPIDLENGDYKIYVRAYDENNENTECVSTSEDFTDEDETYFEFSIVANDGATVMVKENLENVQASCGDENVEVKFMVYNTGDDDEEKVLVMLENSKLGIKEKLVIDNIRDKKGKEATFYITIPNSVDRSFAELDIYTYYDYDEDEDELEELIAYGESSEEEGDDFSIGLEILSCQASSDATIAIDLESETTVGKQVIIKATITNDGDDNEFIISISGLDSWAESITVSPLTASIEEGESEEVTITFIPTQAGEQTFEIDAISNGQTTSQSAVINIKDKPSLFSGISNTMLYIIAGIAAILILIFLALIVRVSRRQVKPQF